MTTSHQINIIYHADTISPKLNYITSLTFIIKIKSICTKNKIYNEIIIKFYTATLSYFVRVVGMSSTFPSAKTGAISS